MILFQLLTCLLVADFISGLLHWAEDTYAAPGIAGKWFDNVVVVPNIVHHKSPGKIAKATYWENTKVSYLLALAACVLLLICNEHSWQPYLVVLLTAQMNQTHAFAHTRKVSRVVEIMQQIGLIQSTDHHSVHHKKPYMVRYCTGTNYLNPVLDAIGFWRLLERVVLNVFGVEPKRGGKERSGY
jgi:hypothetical protein